MILPFSTQINGEPTYFPEKILSGLLKKYEEIKQLAINDGFEDVENLIAYFNKVFTGKIIHWTDLRY